VSDEGETGDTMPEDVPERSGTEELPEDSPGEDAATDADATKSSAVPESGLWDGRAAQVPRPDDANSAGSDEKKATDSHEESLEYDSQTSRYRLDFPSGGQFRDVAGEIHHHYYATRHEVLSPGLIPIPDLRRASVVHVRTPSDAVLGEQLQEHQVVFCRGAPGTGRSQSVTVVLDRLTGYSRVTSKVIVLDSGLSLLSHLEAGCGHLLDGTEAAWTEVISRAQLNQAREVIGQSGFLVILMGADSAAPLAGPAVDHVAPELGKVAVFQLAVRLLGDLQPNRERLAQARARAQALIEEACHADDEAQGWFEELASATTAGPTEAVRFAEAIWNWHKQKLTDPAAVPRVTEFRSRHRYEQAAGLLRRSDSTDSPLRQSYAISAAVLDGLALNEVIDSAGKLAALLAEVEHPGEPGQREIFAQPLARWLRHVEMAAPGSGSCDPGGTVVKMPSRELARIVIELAWREYDAARMPVLTWLMTLCAWHRDNRVRIRAVQALAFIAAHDYALIKERVLDVWSSPDSRPVEQLAASWLLEAMVLDGTSTDKVLNLLRHWSRSPEPNKRGVAVRAYGTAIASKAPEDAIQGVRISAVLPGLRSQPELALCEMYMLRLTREVTAELTLWKQGFPALRERAGRVLVRISQVRRIAEGESDGPYDLLWLLAHAPGEVDASTKQLAELWLLACSHESSRSYAWRMLGRWAQSCRNYHELSGSFALLADEFEKAAGDDDLGGRLRVYRRRWNSYLDEETQK
jgi:hypothetical protein